MAKPDSAKPWRCPRCGAMVYVTAQLHEVICYLYRRRNGEAEDGAELLRGHLLEGGALGPSKGLSQRGLVSRTLSVATEFETRLPWRPSVQRQRSLASRMSRS